MWRPFWIRPDPTLQQFPALRTQSYWAFLAAAAALVAAWPCGVAAAPFFAMDKALPALGVLTPASAEQVAQVAQVELEAQEQRQRAERSRRIRMVEFKVWVLL